MSDIPEGYKMSELGVIPSDWNVKTFGEVMTGFSSGATPYRGRSEYYKGKIRWITSGELNYNVITDTIEKITENAVRNTNLKIHPKGTFLMAITGLEAEGTRGSCGIVGAEATTNQSCMALFPTKELLTEYLFHYYVNYGNSLALEYCQGTKQQSYTAKIVKILPIIVPPTIEEQQAIASALSDVDALISALEQLITKKRNIKQGAMQQLLPGKKRLPGFSGEWDVKKIKNISSITTGAKNTQDKIDDAEYPFFVRSSIVERINSYSFDGEAVLTAGDGVGTGKVFHYINGKFDFHQRVYKISDFCEKIDGYFFYLFFSNYFLKRIMAMTAKSSVDSVRMEMIAEMPIPLPPLPEQQAIAQILSDMDSEIETMEQKQAKYKAIKQGMMQELLTGKMRLV